MTASERKPWERLTTPAFIAQLRREDIGDPVEVLQDEVADLTHENLELARDRAQLQGEIIALQREVEALQREQTKCQTCGRQQDRYAVQTEKCSRRGRYACTRRQQTPMDGER